MHTGNCFTKRVTLLKQTLTHSIDSMTLLIQSMLYVFHSKQLQDFKNEFLKEAPVNLEESYAFLKLRS